LVNNKLDSVSNSTSRIGNSGYKLIVFLLSALALLLASCEREISVTPPDVPPPTGVIFLDSNPDDALIFINGRDRRRLTPDSIKWLASGDYEITLKKEYFKDTTFVVNVEEGIPSNVFVDYYSNTGMLGRLTCISIPANAAITIDGSETGQFTPYTFVNLIPGNHSVEYSLEDHRSAELSVAVSSGVTSTLESALVDTTVWMDYNVANNALPTNNLTCILSASGARGAVWIGTETFGLIKYVRGEWVNYDATTSAISHNQINCVEQDSMGHIWVGTMEGLTEIQPNLYHTDPRRDDDLTQWNFRNSPLPSMQINAIGIGEGNTVWIGTDQGLSEVRISDQYYWGVSVSSTNSGLPDDNVTAIAISGFQKYAGTGTAGIAQFANYQNITIHNTSSGLFRNSISAMTVDVDQNIWVGHKATIGNSGGLSKSNGAVWENFSHIVYGENVNVIYVDSQNRIWVGTDRALYLVINNSRINEYGFNNVGLTLTNITGITEDKDGFIWISTFGNGMIRLNPNNLF